MEIIQISLKIDPEEEPEAAEWIKGLQERQGRRVVSLNIRKAIRFYLSYKDESGPVPSGIVAARNTKGVDRDGETGQ